jgi:hypothetical protein
MESVCVTGIEIFDLNIGGVTEHAGQRRGPWPPALGSFQLDFNSLAVYKPNKFGEPGEECAHTHQRVSIY